MLEWKTIVPGLELAHIDIEESGYERINREVGDLFRDDLPISMFGKQMTLPRSKAFYCGLFEDGSYPLYRYTGWEKYPTPVPFVEGDLVTEIRNLLREETGESLNHCVVNKYITGDNYIGAHKDKDRDFVEGAYIYTVTVGGTRTFSVYHNVEGKWRLHYKLDVKHGDVVRLSPQFNSTYKHAIMKTKKRVDSRISITLRSIESRYSGTL